MRYDVKKFLFIGPERYREHFFKNAQEAGIIHFISLKSDGPRGINDESVQNILRAIKILRRQPPTDQEESDEYHQADTITNTILEFQSKLEKLYEEQRILTLEIERVRVFGNFSWDDIAYIERKGHRNIQFFFAKKGAFKDTPPPDEVIYIGDDDALDYFISINKEPKAYPKLIEMQITRTYGELKTRLQEVTREIHVCDHELMYYAKYNTFLHHALTDKLNNFNLHFAEGNVKHVFGDLLFVTEGWVPVNKIGELNDLIRELEIEVEEIAIEKTDIIPTYLQNSGLARVGEDLVNLYDTPSHTDKDPSMWVLWAFALFFAFIVADAGYGLIYLGIALFITYKFPKIKGVPKRILKLFTLLAISCIIWGVLTSSIFGLKIDLDNPIRKVSITTWLAEKKASYHMEKKDASYEEWIKEYPQVASATNAHDLLKGATTTDSQGHVTYEVFDKLVDGIMMELALLIGIIHISLSFMRYLDRHWSGIGWIIFLIGGYLAIPAKMQLTSIPYFLFDIDQTKGGHLGLLLVYWGIGIALVLGIIQHKLMGLAEGMHAIQVFADILSYIRLYALALAGTIVAEIANEATGALPLVLGFILLLFAHSLNMVLGIMSGIIHGWRLNFVEWVHYSFEGGGKQFKPLELMKIEK